MKLRCTFAHPDFFAKLGPAIVEKLDKIHPISCVYLMWTFSKAGVECQELFDAVAKRVGADLTRLDRCGLTMFCWSYAYSEAENAEAGRTRESPTEHHKSNSDATTDRDHDRWGGAETPMYVCVGDDIAAPSSRYTPQPHEYALSGFDEQLREIRRTPERYDGAAVFRGVLLAAPPKSVVVQLQSGMTDVAKVMAAEPELFQSKVCLVSIMGGLERITIDGTDANDRMESGGTDSDGSARVTDDGKGSNEPGNESGNGPGFGSGHFGFTEVGWQPDSAFNNSLDMGAARTVYAFCLAHNISMNVVSRNAVPDLPMSLAHEYLHQHQHQHGDHGDVKLWHDHCEARSIG